MKFVRRLCIGGGIFGIIITIAIWLAVIIGWAFNVLTLITMASSNAYATQLGMFIVRIIGIFVFPLGAILGWVT